MGISIGIDLGTSNSVVAVMTEDGPVVLKDNSDRSLQPSVVAMGHGGKPVVGQVARQQLAYAPDTTISSVKRLIGRRFTDDEVRRMRSQVAWRICQGEQGEARIALQGRQITVQEVSAHILAHLAKLAETSTGETVDGAVITVPAYFNDQQRQATRDAAEIARLNCLRIINEPTAAAMAYGYAERKNQRLVVYDLGGGTFDVSVLHLGDDLIEVVSTAGDTFLGGDDFDEAISNHIRRSSEGQDGVTIQDTHINRVRLRVAAERVKRALSDHESVEFKLPGLGRQDGKAVDIKVGLNLHLAKKLTLSLLQRSFVVCDDAIAQAGLTPAQIDGVLLVGGMTRFPPVKEAVEAYFGVKPIDSINPDEVVAVGAAIQASNLTTFSAEPAPVLLDVTPQTLGIGTAGGFHEPLVMRNTSIPTMSSKIFHTATDNQTEVRVRVYQGDHRETRKNYLLGEFILDGLPPEARGEVRVRITFAIDANGIVNVTAEDSATGNSRGMRVEASTNLNAGQVEALRFDEFSQDDASEAALSDDGRDLFDALDAEADAPDAEADAPDAEADAPDAEADAPDAEESVLALGGAMDDDLGEVHDEFDDDVELEMAEDAGGGGMEDFGGAPDLPGGRVDFSDNIELDDATQELELDDATQEIDLDEDTDEFGLEPEH